MGTGNCMSRLSGLFAGDEWLKDAMAANRRGCKQNGCEKHSIRVGGSVLTHSTDTRPCQLICLAL